LNARCTNDLDHLIQVKDAVLVADHNGTILFAKHENVKLTPASTLKILTSLAALHYFGTDYRFATEFYLDADSNLKIKGYGDPMLLSEMIIQAADMICVKLAAMKKNIINDIILDDSYFQSPVIIPGVSDSLEPYDAPNGALCANFNTVSFKQTASGNMVSADPHTPLLPFALKRIRQSRRKEGRIVFSHKEKENTIYAGEFFHYYLDKKGVVTKGRIKTGRVNIDKDRPLATYISGLSLDQVLSKLLEYSNNFMANQILLSLGAKVYGSPATLEKGVLAVSVYARDVLKINDISLVEGSGISRNNLICATDMMKILEQFSSYRHLMRKGKNEFYKTGTLNGIATRAGYIENKEKELYRYVVFINTPGTSMNDIMRIIRKATACGQY
jgi:D-alanyl-D-alanine carboxypeptidase/D-alanyl-D-alanine-endopeptidase (penicillin-binding protein 4)